MSAQSTYAQARILGLEQRFSNRGREKNQLSRFVNSEREKWLFPKPFRLMILHGGTLQRQRMSVTKSVNHFSKLVQLVSWEIQHF
ncbi:hypothetical protein [Mastigocladopsis repens]|uniref:hypothetical protein n=1 Tax=Mastigocladopsis repens TaxID=221287 RepID=UPI0002FA9572|nr:hypothetical protein [Mastigocladopsis repens]